MFTGLVHFKSYLNTMVGSDTPVMRVRIPHSVHKSIDHAFIEEINPHTKNNHSNIHNQPCSLPETLKDNSRDFESLFILEMLHSTLAPFSEILFTIVKVTTDSIYSPTT